MCLLSIELDLAGRKNSDNRTLNIANRESWNEKRAASQFFRSLLACEQYRN